MIMQHGEVSGFNGKNDREFGNNSWKVLSMRGFIPVYIIIQPKLALDFKDIFFMELLF
jgi:hypothetical protein